MQDKNDKTNSPDPVEAATTMAGKAVQSDFVQKIVDKIKNSENILIALSRDPSVDEIAAAIGLTVFLDGMQKHATAIYSGRTPDNLAFLQPAATFETNTDSLQDFIIALSKEKADHLRYKLEGDFVKVFITPYKTNITEEDLTFSHGDYNVDFVIAINVPSAGNLDEALREHGRIMHDASAVNITTGQPGRFGEIEWSNPVASSLCEMVTELVFALQGSDEAPLDRDVATALLTGIVAATDRFSNERTNPDTLGIASKLMSMGADQKLITTNIDGNEIVKNTSADGVPMRTANASKDKTNLAVEHGAPDTPVPTRNPYAEGGPLAGQVGDAAGDTVVNPAMQAAPSLNMAGNPDPASIASETQNVTPDSVVVQPIIPGAPNANTASVPGVPNVAGPGMPGAMNGPAPAGPAVPGNPAAGPVVGQAPTNAPVNPAQASSQMQIPGAPGALATSSEQMQIPGVPVAPAPTAGPAPAGQAESNSRPMATSEPAAPTVRQTGAPIQPPAPKPKETKNYAEMMEAALSEPLPNSAQVGVAAQVSAPSVPAGTQAPAVQAKPAPTSSDTLSLLGMNSAPTQAPAPAPIATPSAPAMEPVANPAGGAILPPPPTPTPGNGMMPPVLPPVQVPPEMTK